MKKCIEVHGEYLCGGETRTRNFLVDPMLRASGWDIDNPARVELEYSTWQSKRPVKVKESDGRLFEVEYEERVRNAKKADYALMIPNGKPLAMIEAKRLNDLKIGQSRETQSVIKANIQVFGYIARSEVQYAGLTDGNRWMLYHVIENSEETPVVMPLMDVSIMSDSLRECVKGLEMLWSLRLTCGGELYRWRQLALDFKAQAGEV